MMFGFRRRANERAAKAAAQMAAIHSAVHAALTNDLQDVLTEAVFASLGHQSQIEAYTASVGAMQRGIDAVLVHGADPYGPELADAESHTRAGAMLARAACNKAVLCGRVDYLEIRKDFQRIVRLPANYSGEQAKQVSEKEAGA